VSTPCACPGPSSGRRLPQRWLKYIHEGAFGRHELYDLHSDPGEQHDLYRADHPLVPALQQRVKEHLDLAQSSAIPVEDVSLDPLLVERLKSLGYLE
jgi:hypothetical protein